MTTISLITILFWLQSTAPDGSDTALDEKLARIETKMADIKSLHCTFTQEKKLAIFDQTLVVEGEIFMKHPDSFAWHVHKPMRYRLIIRDQRLRQWDEDTRRVQVISMKRNPAIQSAMTQMQAWFSGQYTSLKADYSITMVDADALVFVPNEDTIVAGVITQVEVSFLQDESYIRAIKIVEKSGDETTLVFGDTQLNTTFPTHVFDAKPNR